MRRNIVPFGVLVFIAALATVGLASFFVRGGSAQIQTGTATAIIPITGPQAIYPQYQYRSAASAGPRVIYPQYQYRSVEPASPRRIYPQYQYRLAEAAIRLNPHSELFGGH